MNEFGLRFDDAITALEKYYGAPHPSVITNLWEQILWENVAYLTSDERRQAAYDLLRRSVGFEPELILSATNSALEAVTSNGPMSELFAGKLRDCARILLEEFDGSLDDLPKMPLAQAKKTLRRFPGIGEPGAEKILLFAGIHPLLTFDSNGLRVMVRLGLTEESPDYSAMYRSAQRAASSEITKDCIWLISAYQLLKKHGQETCKRNQPYCEECPLSDKCGYRLVLARQ